MPDDDNSAKQLHLATEIVAAYFRRNQVAADTLPTLISTVHEALSRLSGPLAEPATERTPAVPIRRSITSTSVICLDCGYHGQMLRRHLTTAHGLSVEQYRARWKLPADRAITTPAYSERRSAMAKQIGLGRGGSPTAVAGTEMPAPETMAAAIPASKRRGRP